MRFQIGISNSRGGRRYNPYGFTEQGVAMLAGVLHSEIAVKMSIDIINAFVSMRHFISDNANMLQRLRDIDLKLLEHDKNFKEIFKQLQNPKEAKAVLFFKGQMWDATSLIEDIIGKAKKSIILIDGYVDKKNLDLLSKKHKNVTVDLYTSKTGNKLTQKEVTDFNNQYGGLTIKYTSEVNIDFHLHKKTAEVISTKAVQSENSRKNIISDSKLKHNWSSNSIFITHLSGNF